LFNYQSLINIILSIFPVGWYLLFSYGKSTVEVPFDFVIIIYVFDIAVFFCCENINSGYLYNLFTV